MSQNTQDPGLRAALDDARKWVEHAVAPLRPLSPEACRPGEELLARIDAALSATPAHAPGKAGDREGLDERLIEPLKELMSGYYSLEAMLASMDADIPDNQPVKVKAGNRTHEIALYGDFRTLAVALAALAPSPTGNDAPRGDGAEREAIVGRLNRLAKDAWSGSAADWIEQAVFAMSAASRYLAAASPPPVSTEPDSRAVERACRAFVGPAWEARGFQHADYYRGRMREVLVALHPSPPTASGAAAPVGEAGDWKRVAERAGVCMTCALGAPDISVGCTDCLNTGFAHGAPQGFVSEGYHTEQLAKAHDATPTPAPHPVPAGQTTGEV